MTRICLAWGMTLVAASVWAADKVGDAPETDVAIALRAESQSTSPAFDRRAALRSSRESQQQPEAWWQSGFIQVGEKWLPFDEAAGIRPELRQQYEVKRAAARPTAAEQLQLADWCREQGLADQERTHLIRALSTGQAKEPAKILQRLGYRRVGPWWFTNAELKASAEEMQSVTKEWKRLQPKLEKIAAQLEGNSKRRQRAIEALRELASPSAIQVLEQAFGYSSRSESAALVDALAGVTSYRASQTLARIAVLSDWKSIRDSATEELKQRPLEEFVPMLLEATTLPVRSQSSRSVAADRGTSLEWRILIGHESRNAMMLSVLNVYDESYYRRNRDLFPWRGMNVNERTVAEWADSLRKVADQIESTKRLWEEFDERCEATNCRIDRLLAQVTGIAETGNMASWWYWWDHEITDSIPTGPKQTVVVSEGFQQIRAPVRYASCLAAGTPVWTADGFVPIEKIQVGDRMLSKDVETGELAYKPVLQTTRREKAALAKVSVGDDRFEASPGHNFWISGQGWRRTNQLETGMPAHTVTGSATLAVEDTGRKADVFNLVVADFHTYFVGKSMILGHDVIQPSPTDAVVPGLTPALAE